MHIWIPELKALTCAENANHSPAQHPDAARRPHPRRPQLRPLPRRDPGAVGRRGRGALRSAHLAGLGQREGRRRSWSPSATPTSTSTTRPCGWPTRATRRSRPPRSSSCPTSSAASGSTAGYHGTLHHDVRAVYTKELGMWDGDPVSLHPHPPVDSANASWTSIGADKILAEGQPGVRRWRLPLGGRDPAQPRLRRPRQPRGAKTCRPTPTSSWATRPRDRNGAASTSPPPGNCARASSPAAFTTASPDTILAMPIDILFDFAAVHVIGDQAAEVDLRIDFTSPTSTETWTSGSARRAQRPPGRVPRTQLTVSGPKAALVGVVLQPAAAANSPPGDPARRRRVGAGGPSRSAGRVRSQLQHRHPIAARRLDSQRPDPPLSAHRKGDPYRRLTAPSSCRIADVRPVREPVPATTAGARDAARGDCEG